ncbi:MAG: hypothetical protein WCG94_05300 [Methanothrix sp.]
MKEIRSFALENRNNFWISILFKDISGNFSDMSLEVLNEWVSTDDPSQFAAAHPAAELAGHPRRRRIKMETSR